METSSPRHAELVELQSLEGIEMGNDSPSNSQVSQNHPKAEDDSFPFGYERSKGSGLLKISELLT